MCQSQLVENSGKIYAVDSDGKMITEPVTLKPDQDGALQYPGLLNSNTAGLKTSSIRILLKKAKN
jgi:hypothetical protein